MGSKRVGSKIVKSSNKQSTGQNHERSYLQLAGIHVAPALWIVSVLIISSFYLLVPTQAKVETTGRQSTASGPASAPQQQHQQQQDQKNALEAELNSIVQQHDELDGGNKRIAEAIISRLIVDNAAGTNTDLDNELLSALNGESTLVPVGEMVASDTYGSAADLIDPETGTSPAMASNEAMRLRKLLSLLQNIDSISEANQAYPYPASGTMKRTALKASGYQNHQPRGYSRNTYDFGLGKRPDSGFSNKISRFGDQIAAVGQFGKRPSAHRYDFGLGKRVASPAYPRFDFGLGKRAPSRVRYDFGLGK